MTFDVSDPRYLDALISVLFEWFKQRNWHSPAISLNGLKFPAKASMRLKLANMIPRCRWRFALSRCSSCRLKRYFSLNSHIEEHHITDYTCKVIKPNELTIGVAKFRATCLGLMDDVANGKLDRVIVTKRGKEIAFMTKPEAAAVNEPA